MLDGDITSIAVDCVVSNDDVDGRMYTVIASAIKSRAGLDVERQSLAQGPFRRGEAWNTDAGTLPTPIKAVIHVAAMDRRGDTDRETIAECIGSALDAARSEGMDSIAIAAFGTGPRGSGPKVIEMEEWLSEVGKTVVRRFEEWQRQSGVLTTEEAQDESVEQAPSERAADGLGSDSDQRADERSRSGLDVVVVLYEPEDFDRLADRLRSAASSQARVV